MSNRIVPVALLACAVLGAALTPIAAAAPRQTDLTAPEIAPLLGYTMSQLAVPQVAGQPFNVSVPIAGVERVVKLQPYSIRGADFQVLVDHGDGQLVPFDAQAPATYRGTVEGVPDGWATASITDGKLKAMVVVGGETWAVEPLAGLAQGVQVPADAYAIYREDDAVPADKGCGGAIAVPGAVPDMPGAEQPAAEGGVAGGTGYVITEIGADADVEYWQKNGSSIDATMTDIETIINSVAAIYEVQIGVTFEVSTIVVRTGDPATDPYSSAVCETLLNQFRSTWASAPENSIRRDVAQLFTGKNLSGCLGIAWLSSVCNGASGFGYSVVESRAPGLPFTQRVGTSAHEIGHNFSAQHCCGGCSGCSSCRIMCPCIGGCSGIVTSFGTASVASITSYAGSAFCLADEPLPLTPPFFDDFPTTTLNSDNWRYADGVLINSAASNEPSPSLSLNMDAVGAGLYQYNEIRTNFIDMTGLENSGYFVQFSTEHIGVDNAGKLQVDYWTGSPNYQWRTLTVITSDGVDQTDFVQHSIPLDGLLPTPFHSEFRVRFISNVDSSGDDWYIDDVFINGVAAPSNDSCSTPLAVNEGQFPFTTIGATTDGLPTFCSGGSGSATFTNDTWFLYTPTCTDEVTFSTCGNADFDTRLAVYLEGGCPPSNLLACNDDAVDCGTTSELTLQVTPLLNYMVRVGATSGGGTGTLTISCPAQQPCPWDCAQPSDGVVGINDFLELLAEWGGPGACDFDGGVVGINDFLELLANWGPCP